MPSFSFPVVQKLSVCVPFSSQLDCLRLFYESLLQQNSKSAMVRRNVVRAYLCMYASTCVYVCVCRSFIPMAHLVTCV
jgi:hypothetical protein